MKKGLFAIPVNASKKPMNEILEEVLIQVMRAEEWGINEAFFGEHITDKHERITSSLMMVAALSKLTKNIKLGTLTTNLNFYKPAVISSLISLADNICKGRLILGIGCGANRTDVEAIDYLDKDNHAIMLETMDIIKKTLENSNFADINTKNFKVSTKKTGNEELGLGYFNGLFNNRKDLEIIMPALNENSYNVKICAKNNWSIAISNFCSNKIVENHIENYLNFSSLKKEEALKKIRLTKLIYVHEDSTMAKKLAFSDESPFMKVIDIIFNKLKRFNKHGCFGENVNTTIEAANNVLIYGNPDEVSNQINVFKEKFGDFSSLIYVTVPKTQKIDFEKSFEYFANNVKT